ncbi:hypothetical protein STSP2_00254 [Anaerohalosphaera lusitana]|uniref:Uncharacterized protein n=1 Tax=Anaerohalosphaera lusitana TaxID=1936003 RepID=A0A1U9NGP8_9BACT|nr:hypothetical protein [Anaerohalosphaera lusitana]AQT67113.1 hypothetical protein STSP2_00254 [Anaerohalosphaera lusitana]
MFYKDGIDRVRAFGIASGYGENGAGREVPYAALVKWQSQHGDKLHQVYVNGELAGVSSDCGVRQMVVGLPVCFEGPVRIEVVAVDPGEGWKQFDVCDEPGSLNGRVELRWVKLHGLPYEGRYEVYMAVDDEVVDFDSQPFDEGPIWRGPWEKAGFGLDGFGSGGFGFDAGNACGFGRGCFGEGEFGLDAEEFRWVSDELGTGKYRFGVKFLDVWGGEVCRMTSDEITIIRKCRGVKKIRLIEQSDDGSLKIAIG